jgi:hypothetical protein
MPISSLSALSTSPEPDGSTPTTTRTNSGSSPSITRHFSMTSSLNSAPGVASPNSPSRKRLRSRATCVQRVEVVAAMFSALSSGLILNQA